MRLIVCGLLTLGTLACSNAQTAPAGQAAPQTPGQTQESVVADVGGRKVTMKELDDRWQSADPAERARVTQMIYQNRRNDLDQMIGEMLIEEAAKAAGMDVATYTQQELTKRLQPVTDADVQQFFEANKERTQGRTLEQLQGAMREYLTNQRQQQARAQLVEDLKNKSKGVRVLLDPPRQTVTVAADDPYVGPATAPVTIVEYSDYQ
jgi:AraC-like DNA-binding protein